MKTKSVIALVCCLVSLILLPIANQSTSVLVFLSPLPFVLGGLMTAIAAVFNKKDDRRLARIALIINLLNVTGYILVGIYVAFFWDMPGLLSQ